MKRCAWINRLELIAVGLLVAACSATPLGPANTPTVATNLVVTGTTAPTPTPALSTNTPPISPTRKPVTTPTLIAEQTATPPAIAVPPTRRGAGLVFDKARGQLVLFGGIGISPPGVFSDTWLYDGATWSRQTTITAPPARDSGSLVYDPATRTVLLFGGVGIDGVPLGDTWVWDGREWAQRHPAVSPRARGDASMVFDAQRGVIVLFGGMAATANDRITQSLNDTWTWDGRNWTVLHPASSPPPRFAASMAYDPARQVAVLFGGADIQVFNDTWLWNGRTWVKQTPPVTPPERTRAAMVCDPATQQMVLFGGDELSDTWTWDGATWAQVVSQPTISGSALESRLVYDATRRMLLFLITGGKFSWTTSIWFWSGTGWTKRT
jgi:hypothetical protein